jgi:ATP-binding cassette subfamily F protein uup
LFRRDANAFEAAAARLGTAREELAAAEHRWLELEMLREQLENA